MKSRTPRAAEDAPLLTGFAPVCRPDLRVLILGSMPSVLSLARGQYYGNERNAFWPLMASLLGRPLPEAYEERLRLLLDARFGLWDVVRTCARPGSADAAITRAQPNALAELARAHPSLEAAALNGRKAQELFHRFFPQGLSGVRTIPLPSTSPANAALRPAQKAAIWAEALREYLPSR